VPSCVFLRLQPVFVPTSGCAGQQSIGRPARTVRDACGRCREQARATASAPSASGVPGRAPDGTRRLWCTDSARRRPAPERTDALVPAAPPAGESGALRRVDA
jgi:hypothetical protein